VPGWRNFNVWHGRWPHWRADGVVYYTSFRHRRDLALAERRELFKELLKPDGRKWNLRALIVLADRTEALFTVMEAPHGHDYELSDILGRAQKRAAARIMKASGERFPPFWAEPYDRIVRDEEELAGFLKAITEAAGEEADDYDFCWVAPADQ
jgi:hypothetical protein